MLFLLLTGVQCALFHSSTLDNINGRNISVEAEINYAFTVVLQLDELPSSVFNSMIKANVAPERFSVTF